MIDLIVSYGDMILLHEESELETTASESGGPWIYPRPFPDLEPMSSWKFIYIHLHTSLFVNGFNVFILYMQNMHIWQGTSPCGVLLRQIVATEEKAKERALLVESRFLRIHK